MATPTYNLAIETAGPRGGIALGRGETVIATVALPARRRQGAELMPAIDTLLRDHGAGPADLDHLYLDLGPGSFTGLRIAVATAKMLTLTLGVRVVGVDGLDAIAGSIAGRVETPHLAVALATKRGTGYTAVYRVSGREGSRETGGGGHEAIRGANGSDEVSEPITPHVDAGPLPGVPPPAELTRLVDPALRSLDQLLAVLPRPATLIAQKLPTDWTLPADVAAQVDPELEADASVVYQLGRSHAAAGQFADPLTLSPIYAREPEAVTLWREREQTQAAQSSGAANMP